MLTLSPFRLGEQPNIRLGVAMITSASEAISLHEKVVNEMWRGAIKGPAAAALLRSLVSVDGQQAAPAATDVSSKPLEETIVRDPRSDKKSPRRIRPAQE